MSSMIISYTCLTIQSSRLPILLRVTQVLPTTLFPSFLSSLTQQHPLLQTATGSSSPPRTTAQPQPTTTSLNRALIPHSKPHHPARIPLTTSPTTSYPTLTSPKTQKLSKRTTLPTSPSPSAISQPPPNSTPTNRTLQPRTLPAPYRKPPGSKRTTSIPRVTLLELPGP